jgi:hypothetical protein
LPNVSLCEQENEVHYNPYVPPHNDIITYTASAKLTEVTNFFGSGLHINVFGGTNGTLTMTSHDFENGVGTVTFDGDITTIGSPAFAGCTGLTSVTIPNTVTSIDGQAFGSCSSLTSITSLATISPTIQNNTFVNIGSNGTLYVPSGSSGYDVWMGTGDYYLGKYGWTKVEQ